MNQVITIRGNKVITYYQIDRGNWTNQRDTTALRELAKQKYSGEIKYQAKTRIEKRFEYWYELLQANNRICNSENLIGERRFVLITLTLPYKQMHTDKYLKQHALKPFIQKLIYNHSIINWMWKAEPQKNGNIHFHIVIDQYIELEKLKKYWKDIMRRENYLFFFCQNYNENDFNSVDVKGQKEMRNPVAYLTKYFVKNENRRKIDGAVWRMSDNLVHAKNFVYITETINKYLLEVAVNNNNAKKIEHDYATIYLFKHKPSKRLISREYEQINNLYYEQEAKQIFSTKTPDFDFENELTESELQIISQNNIQQTKKQQNLQTKIESFYNSRTYLE